MSTTNGSTAMTGHGGKVAVADYDGASPSATDKYLLARVTEWSINPTTTESAWADSDSAGYTNRVGGRKDCTGTLSGVMDKTYKQYKNLLFNVDTSDPNNNDIVEVILWEDGHETTPNEYWFFPRVLITGFSMTFDIDNRIEVRWTANFAADGIFYRPAQDNIPTVTYSGYAVGSPT